MRKTVPFDNSFLYATAVVGNAATEHPAEVELLEGKTVSHVSLVRVNAGSLVIYLDVATARSLAEQILSVIDNGCDPLWATEPATGEEVDRWVEDIRAGAIGGDVQ
jgi:hypothetical protein